MYLLILVLALLLDVAVSFQAVEAGTLDGLDGFSAFLHIFRGLVESQSAEFDL